MEEDSNPRTIYLFVSVKHVVGCPKASVGLSRPKGSCLFMVVVGKHFTFLLIVV